MKKGIQQGEACLSWGDYCIPQEKIPLPYPFAITMPIIESLEFGICSKAHIDFLISCKNMSTKVNMFYYF